MKTGGRKVGRMKKEERKKKRRRATKRCLPLNKYSTIFGLFFLFYFCWIAHCSYSSLFFVTCPLSRCFAAGIPVLGSVSRVDGEE